MLVICEDCAKKYNIDETKIKGESARFACQECGHIIVVEKPEIIDYPSEEGAGSANSDRTGDESRQESKQRSGESSSVGTPASTGKGLPISAYLLLTLITGFLVISGTFSYLYLKYIPEIINHQIELRTLAITKSFSGVIQKPLLVRNYLQVNKEAQRTSRLPGVAYAAVVNKRGIVIAGFFSDLNRFDKKFVINVKKKGFPKDVLAANQLSSGAKEANAKITVGGQVIYDQVISLANKEGEVHIGVYSTETKNTIHNILLSPLTISLIGVIFVVGLIILLLLNRAITKPTRQLTEMARRISLGEMDLVISPRGPREMRELAIAFDRMQTSVKSALDRLRK